MQSQAKRVAFCSVFVALGLILSYVEALIPINLIIPFPGFKLGLANLAVLLAFFYFGFYCACAVSICRITLSALLFGSFTSFIFSLAGGILTLTVLFLYKSILHRVNGLLGLCVLCAAMHNIGQCLVCAILFGASVITFYLPYLLFFSLITGSLTGIISSSFPKLKVLCKI